MNVPESTKGSMNATTLWRIETFFLFSSSLSIFGRAFAVAPPLAYIYLLLILAYAIGCFKLRPPNPFIMFRSPLSLLNLFIFCTLQLSRFANAQDATSTTTPDVGTLTTYRPIFTVPPPAPADIRMYTFPKNVFGFPKLYRMRSSRHSIRRFASKKEH